MKARFITYGFNIADHTIGAPPPKRFDTIDEAMKDAEVRMRDLEYFYVADKIDGDFKKIVGLKNGKRLSDHLL